MSATRPPYPDTAEPSVVVEEPTDIDPRGGIGTFRNERTVAAEAHTVKLGAIPPWLATPDPEPRPARPLDPLFWPAAVFVVILAGAIGFVLLGHPARQGSRSAGSFSAP